jgi:hypothetical protein
MTILKKPLKNSNFLNALNRWGVVISILLAAISTGTSAYAQSSLPKLITLVVPQAAGGSNESPLKYP